MCLTTVLEYRTPNNVIQDGVKALSNTGVLGRKFEFMNFPNYKIKMDTWMKSQGSVISAGDGKKYEAGFHVVTEKMRGSSGGTKRRVYARQIICVGTQDGDEVLIAREVFIPSDENAWPPK